MLLILPTSQHIPLPSLPFLWPPEGCSRGLAKVIAWILLAIPCKDDHRDSGNVLSWTELLNLNSALHYPRPSRIMLFVLQNTIRNFMDHTQAPNKSGAASCACSPVLFTLLCCSRCLVPEMHTISGYPEPQQSVITYSKLSWKGSRSLPTQGCCHARAQLNARNTNTDWSASAGRATCTD